MPHDASEWIVLIGNREFNIRRKSIERNICVYFTEMYSVVTLGIYLKYFNEQCLHILDCHIESHLGIGFKHCRI